MNFFYKIYTYLPNFIHNLLVTAYNLKSNKSRYGGSYKKYREYYYNLDRLPLEELKEKQLLALKKFVSYCQENSEYYNRIFESHDFVLDKIEDLKKLPILSKESLRLNIDTIITITKSTGSISKTGGTTGKSLEIIYTKDDLQERYAVLDNFRSKFGYELGKKTAWFSGKSILNKTDLKKNRFWKTDFFYKVRYYSTFHVNMKSSYYYLQDLMKYQPEFLVGFPSTIYEIAKYGIENNIDYPKGIKAVFPTSETITEESREAICGFFKTSMYDQYASSEGAPFVFECENGNYHLDLLSGVFEVLDDDDNEVIDGRLIITSFTTHGTPLIRYDIGDWIELSKEKECNCGNNNPLVKGISGRVNDYILSEETGKINLGNVSNCLKDVHGIRKFQVIQDNIDEIVVKVVIDEDIYNKKNEKIFLKNWRERVGEKMKINLIFTKDIKTEKSGKFRMVKNNLKV